MTQDIAVPHLTTALKGPLKYIEKLFLEQQVNIEAWFREQWSAVEPSIYSSVDLRNAGFKVAPVDTNLFPAGFNNLNPDFMSLCVSAMQATVQEVCPKANRMLLIPESHTRNPFYFESLAMIYDILRNAGYEVRIGFMGDEISAPKKVHTPSGKELVLEPLIRKDDKVGVDDFFPCCIVLNNDLSSGVPELLDGISQTVMPSMQLGWDKRLKSEHFRFYEKIALQFSEHIGLDPWLVTPWFDQCPEVDFMKKEGQQCLMLRAEGLLKRILKKYQEYNIKHEPFLVVKADQGTYGMAVMMIKKPEDLLELNRKQRTRMSTSKGGVAVTKAIIQEGVHSFETVKDNSIAEPVVYMIGRHVVGGFYRVHKNKGPDENLNAPGMDFQPLAFAQPCNTPCTSEGDENRFYAYGVIARLASLAAAFEIKSFKEDL